MWCILCPIQNQTWQSTGNEKAQAKQKQKRRRRRRSNWQRHSPSSIYGLRNSCPRILPALQAENFSLEEAVLRITLLFWWRFNWISRIAMPQATPIDTTTIASTPPTRVLSTSPLCNAGQCVCCLVAARRQERCDPAGWPARPGPARSIGAPPDPNYYRWRVFIINFIIYYLK